MAVRYVLIGAGVSAFGCILALIAYLILGIIPLVAFGLACIILGLTAANLPEQVSGSGAMRSMLQGAVRSIEVRLQEIDLATRLPKGVHSTNNGPKIDVLESSGNERAVYLPPKEDGLVSVYIPLGPNPKFESLEMMRKAPTGIVSTEQAGVLLYPLSADLGRIPELQRDMSLEDALAFILVESAGLCSAVRESEVGNTVVVEIENIKVNTESTRYLETLGSIPTSVAACIITILRKTSVTFLGEQITSNRTIASFRVGT